LRRVTQLWMLDSEFQSDECSGGMYDDVR
jgi:hypothetical protein